ncbi:MAG: FAD/NAD(P)-binding protein [Bacteroidota bacterium]|nr:FAD/NAD(P)-binding protein [Bacteroidota bacterium]MDP4274311.1 FAD/NAD(P)-binding protein [Bacteroidota bacterium]
MEKILTPALCKVEAVVDETPDVKTFRLKFVEEKYAQDFQWKPGQFVEFSLFGHGECTFCIASSPTRKGTFECSVKKAGQITSDIHDLVEEGSEVGIRGPYGNNFPLEDIKGKNLLFIGGGIGMAPVRSLIQYVLDNRKDYKDINILYGSRSPADLVYKSELEEWKNNPDIKLTLTVDRGDDEWKGNVGVVPKILEEVVKPTIENTKVITCGPPIMIKFTVQSLLKLGFAPKDIITTLEMKMQCGLGKCGRCNIGHIYVCKDGPVFTYDQLQDLPDEF